MNSTSLDITQHEDVLRAIAFSVCKKKHLVDDVIQDVYLEALSKDITSYEELKKMCAKKATATLYQKFTDPAHPFGKIGNLEEADGYEFLWNKTFETQSEDFVKREELEEGIKNIAPIERKFLDFETARAFVHTLQLKSLQEWKAYCKNDMKPKTIPATPNVVYSSEFISYQDWMGYSFFTYEEAERYVQSVLVPIGINSKNKWVEYRKNIIKELPKDPRSAYQGKGWISWTKFFGTNRRSGKNIFLSYKEAQKWVQDNLVPRGIDTIDNYHAETLPDFLPSDPPSYYKGKGWVSSKDFFGTKHRQLFVRKNFLPYEEAREWVRLNLRIEGITTVTKWRKYVKGEYPNVVKIPDTIPHDSCTYYTSIGKWKSWYDFLGKKSNRSNRKKLWSYEKAREWVIENLSIFNLSRRIWEKYVAGHLSQFPELPEYIPKQPWIHYRNDWKGFSHWFGCTDKKKGVFTLSYIHAKEYVRIHLVPKGIDTPQKYKHAKSKISSFLPKEPNRTYKSKGWISWDDFFGKNGTVSKKREGGKKGENFFISYKHAEKYVQENLVPLGIDSKNRYEKYEFLPIFLPRNPGVTYAKKGWSNWNVFFGSERKRQRGQNKGKSHSILSFDEAKEYVQKHLVPKGIDSLGKYLRFKELPSFLPTRPDGLYKGKGWNGANDFFGTKYQKFGPKNFLSMEEAGKWVRQNIIHVITDQAKWRKYVKGGYPNLPQLPQSIPSVPDITYRNQGWSGYKDWFGLKIKYLSFADAKKCVREKLVPKGITSGYKYLKYENLRVLNLPPNPNQTYKKDGWNGWDDFFRDH